MESQTSDAMGDAEYDYRWLPAAAFYVTMAGWGALQLITPDSGAVYLLTSVALASTASSWVMMDASKRRTSMPLGLQFCVFILWPLTVPIYLISTRGFRGVVLVAINLIAIIVVVCLFFYATLMLLPALPATLNN